MARRQRRRFGKIDQQKSGRFLASYIGPDQVRHYAPVTYVAMGDAEEWLNREERLRSSEDWTPPEVRRAEKLRQRLTLDDYAVPWLAERDLKPRTRDHYYKLLKAHILPKLGHLELRDITPTVVRNWYAGTAKDTPTTRAHAYSLLRTVLMSAADEELITGNPCHIRGAGSAPRRKTIEPATIEQLEAITNAMPDRYQLMVMLSAWCALRFGELAELRRRDVDVEAGLIRIRRALVRVNGDEIVGTPKSGAGVRDVNIPPHLLPMVAHHLKAYAERGQDGLLFPAKHGGHMRQSSLTRVFYPAREKAGRPDLRWHDLRHTGAVLAASTGATLAELMARLGHSTAGAALRYQHAARGRDAEIAAALSALVNPPTEGEN